MRLFTVWAAIVAAALRLDAQTPAATNTDHALHVEIARMDSLLFAALNARDLTRLKTFFAPDLEFYQDNEGLVRYEQTVRDFESLFAQGNQMRRKLVEGSLEVYPIKDYGAVEMGAHQFCHVENGKDECGTFRFVHLWQRGGGAWKISRVVSYAH